MIHNSWVTSEAPTVFSHLVHPCWTSPPSLPKALALFFPREFCTCLSLCRENVSVCSASFMPGRASGFSLNVHFSKRLSLSPQISLASLTSVRSGLALPSSEHRLSLCVCFSGALSTGYNYVFVFPALCCPAGQALGHMRLLSAETVTRLNRDVQSTL